MVASILLVIALALLNILYEPGVKPDAEFPMVNQKIVWEK